MNDPVRAGTAVPATGHGGGAGLTLDDVRAAIGASAVWCPDPAVPVTGVVTADLMSDVLVDARPGYVLITGLANVQTIRTAAIADLSAVVFARGKAVPPEVVELAREMKVPIFTSARSLYEAAGGLYAILERGEEGAAGRRA
jgi:hypothetical protein